jgi:hypothetical protein
MFEKCSRIPSVELDSTFEVGKRFCVPSELEENPPVRVKEGWICTIGIDSSLGKLERIRQALSLNGKNVCEIVGSNCVGRIKKENTFVQFDSTTAIP